MRAPNFSIALDDLVALPYITAMRLYLDVAHSATLEQTAEFLCRARHTNGRGG
jgi:hypothetical protein